MKKLILLLAVIKVGMVFGAEPDPEPKQIYEIPPAPMYMKEFAYKLGLDPLRLGPLGAQDMSLRELAIELGLEIVLQNAEKARDSLTGGPYFKISRSEGEVVIEKCYPLIDVFRTSCLTLYKKDERGRFAEAFYSEAVFLFFYQPNFRTSAVPL
jgi:hypothetical protein